MPFQIFIYITLLMIWMLPLQEVYAEDSIINQYDTNGSLVSGDGKFYEYNDANQLVRVREKDAIGAVVAEYFYDHTGQRVKKVESGVTTYYLGKYYETQVVQGQMQNTSYYFAEGDRVAKKDSTGSYYYHPDHLGGTSAVTNSTGQIVSSTSYLPFGDVRQGGAEKYSYTGKEMDKATGLYNFDARYTSPELRHFTQADIADPDFDDPQDLNRYAYVGNNPTSFIDPDGYKKKKKAKLSKREKWMIAHGVDPDHDKTTLKKAKKLEKAGKKYVVAAKKSSGTPSLVGATGAGRVFGVSTISSSYSLSSASASAIPLCGSSSWACNAYKAQKASDLDPYQINLDITQFTNKFEAATNIVVTATSFIPVFGKIISVTKGLFDAVNIDQENYLYDKTNGVMGRKSNWSDYLNLAGENILSISPDLIK